MPNMIIAGGLGILGQAIVSEVARRGNRVAVVDFANGDHQDADLIIGGCDLADEAAGAAAYQQVATELGPICGLANVAGGFLWETVEQGSLDSWDRMYRMNLRTTAASSQAILPHLGNGGSIVNVGAAAAAAPNIGMAPYAASKAGVAALTQSLAEELRPRRIRVNAVLPTILDTPTNRAEMPDADRKDWISPDDAARVIAFLLSSDAAAVTGAQISLSFGS